MRETIQCPGFEAAGIAAGIKKNGALDLGLIYSRVPAVVAGVFTRNLVQAAPVILSRQRVANAQAQAIVVNAGNANCCNGEQGMTDAKAMTHAVGDQLKLGDTAVLVASTGVIGAALPIDQIVSAAPVLAGALSPDGFEPLARAIMTTDTVPKLVQRQVEIDGRMVTLVAVAKGAGMIRPDMATMLCFVCTDAQISSPLLQQCLKHAVDGSLNRMTIDGDTSTNDTAIIIANGVSGAAVETPAQYKVFGAALDEVLMDVAHRLVKDGEGVTKVVRITVKGAASSQDAFQMADTIGHSPLVKTAFFGEDANWGRILAAAGRSGVSIDSEAVDLFFDQIQLVKKGRWCGPDAEIQATAVLKQPEFTVTLDLHLGQCADSLLTCDFSLDYVKINADYRS